MRDPNGRFLPGGPSANPGGRPALLEGVREAAKQHTPQAIETLASIMNDPAAPPAARTAAATSLLDRAWGRPGQSLDMTLKGPDIAVAHLEALRELTTRKRTDEDEPVAH